jgi:hypothetical protein
MSQFNQIPELNRIESSITNQRLENCAHDSLGILDELRREAMKPNDRFCVEQRELDEDCDKLECCLDVCGHQTFNAARSEPAQMF